MKKLFSLIGGLIALGLLVSACEPVPYDPKDDSTILEGSGHWARSSGSQTVVTVQIQPDGEFYRPYVNRVAGYWSELNNLEMRVGNCVNTGLNCITLEHEDGVPNGSRCGGRASPGSWRRTSDVRDRHFTQGWVQMNMRNCASRSVSVDHVVCHELGHALGLGHGPSNDGEPCDTATGRPWRGDYDRVRLLLSHVDRSGPAGV